MRHSHSLLLKAAVQGLGDLTVGRVPPGVLCPSSQSGLADWIDFFSLTVTPGGSWIYVFDPVWAAPRAPSIVIGSHPGGPASKEMACPD